LLIKGLRVQGQGQGFTCLMFDLTGLF